MTTANDILQEYLKWRNIARESHWRSLFSLTPKHERVAAQYDKLASLMRHNQDAVIELFCSGQIAFMDIERMLSVMGHGGSVAKEDNLHMIPFYARLRERKNELPIEVQASLDWLWEVHGY